jgi:hypothetical protein
VTDLNNADMHAAAGMFQGKTITGFAKWRWGTLYDVCKGVALVLGTLVSVWGALTFVHKIRDNALIKVVNASIHSVDWREHQFFFVHWYSHWLVKLQRWGMGCECHRAQLEAGEKLDCPMKGRLLRVAFDHAMKHLENGVREVIRI